MPPISDSTGRRPRKGKAKEPRSASTTSRKGRVASSVSRHSSSRAKSTNGSSAILRATHAKLKRKVLCDLFRWFWILVLMFAANMAFEFAMSRRVAFPRTGDSLLPHRLYDGAVVVTDNFECSFLARLCLQRDKMHYIECAAQAMECIRLIRPDISYDPATIPLTATNVVHGSLSKASYRFMDSKYFTINSTTSSSSDIFSSIHTLAAPRDARTFNCKNHDGFPERTDSPPYQVSHGEDIGAIFQFKVFNSSFHLLREQMRSNSYLRQWDSPQADMELLLILRHVLIHYWNKLHLFMGNPNTEIKIRPYDIERIVECRRNCTKNFLMYERSTAAFIIGVRGPGKNPRDNWRPSFLAFSTGSRLPNLHHKSAADSVFFSLSNPLVLMKENEWFAAVTTSSLGQRSFHATLITSLRILWRDLNGAKSFSGSIETPMAFMYLGKKKGASGVKMQGRMVCDWRLARAKEWKERVGEAAECLDVWSGGEKMGLSLNGTTSVVQFWYDRRTFESDIDTRIPNVNYPVGF